MTTYKIFNVGEDYIIAETEEQAIECHLEAIGPDWYGLDKPEVEEIPFDRNGMFETEHGYQEITFSEWLADFEYTEPKIVCWNE